MLLGRRRLGEAAFRTEIARRPPIAARAALFDSIATVEAGLTRIGGRIYAFLSSPSFGSSTLARASLAVQYADARAAGAPPERLKEIAERAAAIANRPAALERLLAAAQFQDLKRGLGERDTLAAALFAGRTADQAAADLLSHTALSDSARVPALFQGDLAASGDAAFLFARRASRVVVPLRQEAARLSARADNLAARLARVRFDVYGKTLPPDATFTLRLADGVVRGYPYNGTRAVPFTTFYGMYDRYAAAGGQAPWSLPPRWQRPPAGLDLATPLDLVSTNDIIGGNSGSPLLNRKLELVGLIFDGNIESLPGDFIYTDDRARAISVDARAILAALRTAYGATRIVEELVGR